MMSYLLVLDKEREQLRHRMCPYFAQRGIVETLLEAYHVANVRLHALITDNSAEGSYKDISNVKCFQIFFLNL